MMGRTPNIDSIAKNGALFTDHYGQPSCTAGRGGVDHGPDAAAFAVDGGGTGR
jgi:arylsulfatase A-like enzyme